MGVLQDVPKASVMPFQSPAANRFGTASAIGGGSKLSNRAIVIKLLAE
jgi:hypothetical protein